MTRVGLHGVTRSNERLSSLPTLETPPMNAYTVRYQLGGEEHTDSLEADNAAAAARLVEERYVEQAERFELIEVHLVESDEDSLASESQPA